jgi:hypothetical protein
MIGQANSTGEGCVTVNAHLLIRFISLWKSETCERERDISKESKAHTSSVQNVKYVQNTP